MTKHIGDVVMKIIINTAKIVSPLIIFIIFLIFNYFTYEGVNESVEKYCLYDIVHIIICDLIAILIFGLIYKFFYIKILNSEKYKIKIFDFRCVLGIVLIVPFVIVAEYTVAFWIYGGLNDTFAAEEFRPEWKELCWYTFHGVLIAPVLEELVLRILMISQFRSVKAKTAAIIISSLIFSMLHSGSFVVKSVDFLTGIVLALTLVISKNIFLPVLIHASSNFAVSLLWLIQHINSNLIVVDVNTGASKVDIKIMACAVAAAFVGVVLIVCAKKDNKNTA